MLKTIFNDHPCESPDLFSSVCWSKVRDGIGVGAELVQYRSDSFVAHSASDS